MIANAMSSIIANYYNAQCGICLHASHVLFINFTMVGSVADVWHAFRNHSYKS